MKGRLGVRPIIAASRALCPCIYVSVIPTFASSILLRLKIPPDALRPPFNNSRAVRARHPNPRVRNQEDHDGQQHDLADDKVPPEGRGLVVRPPWRPSRTLLERGISVFCRLEVIPGVGLVGGGVGAPAEGPPHCLLGGRAGGLHTAKLFP